MQLPSDFKYTHCHRWVKMKGEYYVTVGISDHTQELLGDIVYVENPPAGTVLQFEHALRYDGIGQDCFRYSCSASGTVEAINIKLDTSRIMAS